MKYFNLNVHIEMKEPLRVLAQELEIGHIKVELHCVLTPGSCNKLEKLSLNIKR